MSVKLRILNMLMVGFVCFKNAPFSHLTINIFVQFGENIFAHRRVRYLDIQII